MPMPIQAALWGLLAASAFLLGAAVAWFAAVMAFGSGVLVSALSFELMDEAYRQGGFDSTALGFLGGAAVYTAANIAITRRGGAHRKRSGDQRQKAEEGRASPSRSARCWTASRSRW